VLTPSLILFVGLLVPGQGDESLPQEISFTRDVRPILAEKCLACHGPDEEAREGDLRLDQPGSEGLGEVLERVRAEGKRRMPPRKHDDALGSKEIEVLARWVAAGSPFEEHWAYRSLGEVVLPLPEPDGEFTNWGANPIDAFILRRLQEAGLSPTPEADPESLLRRVFLDLTGLPPTLEEQDAFLADSEAGAYGRVVERLLESQAYAEHWAAKWLDLARYADSRGFTIDGRRSIWPWRDWVLDSIHRDEPFDSFTLRQLAGDLLPGATNADVIATGFHRNTQINQEGGAKNEENRINAVHDRVATTGTVWLGTTVGCAQCHDHKFDPFSARDYYGLFAFFNSTEDGGTYSETNAYVARTPEEELQIAEFEAGVAQARERLQRAAEDAAQGWSTWQPRATKADNGPELVPEIDGSYSVHGQGAIFSAYTLTGLLPADGLTDLRIEALPRYNLGGGGPGRSGSGNFVLNAVEMEWREVGADAWTSVPFVSAVADMEQDTRPEGGAQYKAAMVLDGKKNTGWAVKPQFGQPHVLHLRLGESIPGGDREMRVMLRQDFGNRHTLGHFRLRTRKVGAAEAREPLPDNSASVPGEWVDASRALTAAQSIRLQLNQSPVLRERSIPRQSHIFNRGNFLDLGDEIEPGFPSAIGQFVPRTRPLDSGPESAPLNRLDLARWLVHSENTLVQRVTINRWWQSFFGLGLVRTEDNFGLRGATPSHPDLLEWLVQDFVRGGYSRKAMHRLIVLSQTYRQSVPVIDRSETDDPLNRLLAGQRRLRLPAESIRDSALVASSLLTTAFGGPPVQPPQPDGVFQFTQSVKEWRADKGENRFRRTLYTRRWRSSVFPFLTTFDAPDPTTSCTRRESSTSPLQALTLANDPMMLQIAEELGVRALKDSDDESQAVRITFRRALSREPSEAEQELLLEFLHGEMDQLALEGVPAGRVQMEAWTALARVLFNLDEFVTRP
jgi:hypothetical protein